MKQPIHTKTVICQECRGEGGHTKDLENYYCVYGRKWAPCSRCKGSGRLIKTISYAPAPFGPTPPADAS